MGAGAREADLYPAVKVLLEGQGYAVKGEVGACDVLATRDEDVVVVELKRTLDLAVVLQAVDRLAVTPDVYVGVPRTAAALRRHPKRVLRLLRMLGLGLLAVDAGDGTVEVRLDPGPYQGPRRASARRTRLLGEFARRVGDPNAGGSVRTGELVTAYRQRAIAIGRFLETSGPSKAAAVAAAVGDAKARAVLYRDVYGWFERVERGVYGLSPRGAREVPAWAARVAEE